MIHSIIITVIILLMSIVAFVLYASDKRRAKTGRRRIRERTLLLVAALGGGIGAMIAMQKLRHKTQHRNFVILVPIFMVLNIIILVLGWIF